MTTREDEIRRRVGPRLGILYGAESVDPLTDAVLALVRRHADRLPEPSDRCWNESTVVLITYGDQVRRDGQAPLATLRDLLQEQGVEPLIEAVHLLPFYPYSSDDGFSVIDFEQVDPALGAWSDVADLSRRYRLMFDLVLNHVSSRSEWFQGYLSGDPTYREFFLEIDPATDLSSVIRPRNLPLLTPVDTAAGRKHVWTTFSADQIDLNYSHPPVLLAMLDVLLTYVARGAKLVRLDAVAFLWKRLGSTCLHLPETHEVIKLLRDLLDIVAPGTVLVTETNVPHEENISYFGAGDEADMVYQFSLPPLLLDALSTGDAGPLNDWAHGVCRTEPGTTYFNFTASHDGVGVRPLQGLVADERFDRLIRHVERRGGAVSRKRDPDGAASPYELNITYFSALDEPNLPDPADRSRRFLSSQAIALALRGVPGIYFHSLIGTPDDQEGVARTGRARSINRRRFDWDELHEMLDGPDSVHRHILERYRHMLATRTAHPAFHPEAPQEIVDVGTRSVFAFLRVASDGTQRILSATNVSSEPQSASLSALPAVGGAVDLLTGEEPSLDDSRISLQPYQTVWLKFDRS